MNKKVFFAILIVLLISILSLGYLIIKPDSLSKVNNKFAIQGNDCSFAGDDVNIVMITDDNYVSIISTAIVSAIQNKCASSVYNFYIITENLTTQDNVNLINLAKISPQSVNITLIPVRAPDLPLENMGRFQHYKAGMHKLFLADILPNLDKVLYLDADIIVLKDLSKLYNKDVSDIYTLAAKDSIFYRFPEFMKNIGVYNRGFYFNSGVMLLNLSLIRENKIIEKFVEFVENNKDFFGDQDVLNIVLEDKVGLLSYRYNCISTFLETDDIDFLSWYYGEKFSTNRQRNYENATIIHYAGEKPWNSKYKESALKDLWYKYYEELRKL